MLRYKTETRPGLVALYDIRPGNGVGQFLQPPEPAWGSKKSKWSEANNQLYLAKETSMDWPSFETWRTSAWNYSKQNAML